MRVKLNAHIPSGTGILKARDTAWTGLILLNLQPIRILFT